MVYNINTIYGNTIYRNNNTLYTLYIINTHINKSVIHIIITSNEIHYIIYRSTYTTLFHNYIINKQCTYI